MNAKFFAPLSNLLSRNIWMARGFMFLVGALYPLGFAPFSVWPAGFISLIVLVYFLSHQKILSGFQLAYFWGLGCFSVGVSWVYISIHEFGFVPVPGALALTGIFIAFLALFKGLFGWLCERIRFKLGTEKLLIFAPLFWLISELIQSSIFNGFPWLLSGYMLTQTFFAHAAAWISVYGLSWFIMLFSILIIRLILNRGKKDYLYVGLSLSFVLAFSLGKIDSTKEQAETSIKVALIQPNVDQLKKWDRRYFNEIVDDLIVQTESVWDADLIVWPEGAIPTYEHNVSSLTAQISQMASHNDAHLIVGIPEYNPKTQRSYVSLKSYGDYQHTYHKQVLVPFGEYVPLEDWLRGAIEFLNLPMSGFSIPEKIQKPMAFDDFTVVPAICYEIVYPGIVQQLANQGERIGAPQFIVTVSNEAWFGDSLGPYQHLEMAQMRSIELGIPLIRSTNDGITVVIDSFGQILARLPRYESTNLVADLSLKNRPTFFKKNGFVGLYGILILQLIVMLFTWYLSRRN